MFDPSIITMVIPVKQSLKSLYGSFHLQIHEEESCTSEPPRGRYFNYSLPHAHRLYQLQCKCLSFQKWQIEQNSRHIKYIPLSESASVLKCVLYVKSKCYAYLIIFCNTALPFCCIFLISWLCFWYALCVITGRLLGFPALSFFLYLLFVKTFNILTMTSPSCVHSNVQCKMHITAASASTPRQLFWISLILIFLRSHASSFLIHAY